MEQVKPRNELKLWKPAPKPERDKMSHLTKIVVVLLSVSALGCATVIGGKPRRCVEDWTWAEMDDFDNAFKPVLDEEGAFRVTENVSLADRVDYLDAYCKSINEYRGD